MKKTLKSLLLVALFACTTLPAWSQASTEGKEFWVALNITVGTAGGDHEPFICITTQHPGGSYTITNPADASFTPITGLIPPTGYVKIKASTSPGTGDIDLNKWYPVGQTAQAISCQIKNVGLKVTTTVDCSVFAGNMLTRSFDAANILPITALQMDYVTQDYPGYEHEEGKGGGYPVTTILATENNTRVTINPSSAVLNNNGTTAITKTLNAGQVLYLTGNQFATLSGSIITSDKKIAVFTGVNNTDVPGPKSARDHLYEQNMPIDYWGTHFVVTRSMKKDANRIRITAKENGTSISVDGYEIATINSGETYEFELCSPEMRTQSPYTSAVGEGRGTEFYFDGAAHYVETSCPCAVFSYDVSENYYISSGTSERDPNAHGDPSMVWISPLEQQLRKITFGVMNTDMTTAHYVNIITPTEGASSLEVREVGTNAGQVVYGNNMVNPADIQPVPSNPAYSYARVKLVEDAEKVYTITSGIGFIAHVYGSGDKESYAYSCGSAAVQQGIKVDGETFTNGFKSDSRFCLNTPLQFDAKVGTDEITRVDWTFGDGTSEYNGMPQTEHTYMSPGWYDVTAKLFGHQVCTNESDVELGTVHFTFRVMPPDTVYMKPEHRCISVDSVYDGRKLTAEEIAKMIANGGNDTIKVDPDDCASEVHITPVSYGIDTEEKLDTITGEDMAVGYNDSTYYVSTDVIDTIPATVNRCAIYRKYYVKVISCLGMTVTNDSAAQHVCPNNTLEIEYTKTKGDVGKAQFVIPGILEEEINLSNDNTLMGKISLPTQNLQPGLYKGQLKVEDLYCSDKTFPIDVAVYYPDNIFLYKFNNVLAVYQKGFEGNEYCDLSEYTFQWYRNYLPIEGATKSVLYLGDSITFAIGDEVHVALTDKKGVTIPSCSQTILTVPDYNKPETENAPARKMIINNQFVILKGESTYDIYGQKVQ